MTQGTNGQLRQAVPHTRTAAHASRASLIADLQSMEEATERLSFLTAAEVFKMENLKHKTLPDVDAYWAMVKVHREFTDSLLRVQGTLEAAGLIPPSISKEGAHGRSPLR